MSQRIETDQNSKMAQLLDEEGWDIKSFEYGDIVEGRVVSKGTGELLVDIGGKSEGIITGKELDDSYNTFEDAEVGDKIVCFVIHDEDDQGYVVLSLRRAETEKRWIEIREAHKDKTPMDVKVVDYNKGGLLVDVGSLRGFIPVSHIDRVHFPQKDGRYSLGSRAERDEVLSTLVGKDLQAQVIEIDRDNNRLILSEKLASTKEERKQQEELVKELDVGEVVEGTVSAILPFGIFVDIDGLEGLVHISELSWGKVSDPADLFSKGDEVKVKVTEIDDEENRVSLSIKDLQEDPWEDMKGQYKVGEVVKGTVSKITPYGAFVNIEEGLDGLLHVSETEGPLEEGEEIEAKIISLEPEERKLGLSIKQLTDSE